MECHPTKKPLVSLYDNNLVTRIHSKMVSSMQTSVVTLFCCQENVDSFPAALTHMM